MGSCKLKNIYLSHCGTPKKGVLNISVLKTFVRAERNRYFFTLVISFSAQAKGLRPFCFCAENQRTQCEKVTISP
jgi:hypothetical protein